MSLLLHGVGQGIRPAMHQDLACGQFRGLAFGGALAYFPLDANAATRTQLLNLLFVVWQTRLGQNLKVALATAVVYFRKLNPAFESLRVRTQPLITTHFPADSAFLASLTLIHSIGGSRLGFACFGQ